MGEDHVEIVPVKSRDELGPAGPRRLQGIDDARWVGPGLIGPEHEGVLDPRVEQRRRDLERGATPFDVCADAIGVLRLEVAQRRERGESSRLGFLRERYRREMPAPPRDPNADAATRPKQRGQLGTEEGAELAVDVN